MKNLYAINGDTLINGKVYKKMYNGQPKPSYYIREFSKKVYYTKDNFGNPLPEVLIYDFSVQVGDTLKTEKIGSGNVYKSKVIEIDSIYTKVGYRKRIKFLPLNYGWSGSCNYPDRNQWVEGLGSFVDLISTYFNGGSLCEGSQVLNYVILKSDTLFGPMVDCKYSGVDEDKDFETKLKIFQTDSNIEIKSEQNKTFNKINIFNSMGQLVYDVKSFKSYQFTLEKPKNWSGLFFIQVHFVDDSIITSKILIYE